MKVKHLSKAPFFGPLVLFASNVFLVVSYSSTKYLTPYLSIQELMLLRFILVPFIVFPIIFAKWAKFEVNNWTSIFIRTVVGMLSMLFYFLALKYGDAGRCSLIFQSSIIWVYIFDRVVYKEIPSIQTKCMIPVALIGLWCVIQPKGLIGFQAADILALLGSVFNAGVYITVKYLRKSHNAISIVAANQSLSALVMLIICVATAPTITHAVITPVQAAIAVLLMVGGTVGNFLMTTGFKFTSATVGANITLSIVPMMFIVGAIFFGESLNILSWVGVSMVLTSLLVISKYQ